VRRARCRSLDALYEASKARQQEQERITRALSKRCDDREAIVATLEDQLVKAKAKIEQRQQQAEAARQQAMQAMDTKRTLEKMCSTIQEQQRSAVVPLCSRCIVTGPIHALAGP
jgi:TolA-binding protein